MAAAFLVGVVAVLQFAFMLLEMVFWDTPTGHRLFHISPQFARESRVLAANQGLYNGFLGVGLVWGIWLGRPEGGPVLFFFLGCVLLAGLYGGFTATRNIFFVQALPAAIALLGVLLL